MNKSIGYKSKVVLDSTGYDYLDGETGTVLGLVANVLGTNYWIVGLDVALIDRSAVVVEEFNLKITNNLGGGV
jgi:hypothetical protein